MSEQSFTVNVTKLSFEKNGFCIFRGLLSGGKSVGLKGFVVGDPLMLVDQEVQFNGKIEDSDFGKTIVFSSYSVKETGRYFWSVYCKLANDTVDLIVGRFGLKNDWLDLPDAQEKLKLIKGIGDKKSERILEHWTEYQGVKKLMEALAPYDIPQRQIGLIYNEWKEKSLEVLATSPYRLTEIKGIGFIKADEIARKMGVAERSPQRLGAAIAFAMETFSNEGHTAMDDESVFNELNSLLTMDDGLPAFSGKLSMLSTIENPELEVKVERLEHSPTILSLEKYVYMETAIKNTLSSANEIGTFTMTLKKVLSALDKVSGIKLGDEQKEAVMMACTSGAVVAIAGYAGTGKTTTSKTILNILAEEYGLNQLDVVCCALSGVAANRIKSQSGYPAFTIHSLLGYEGKGFAHNENNKLKQSVIILDEASMVDVWLFYSLLKAIDFNKTKLIMLGDPAQLPPVGAGQPFVDTLNLNLIPSSTLTQIFRQSEDKAITVIAQSVRNGEMPKFESVYSDAFFVAISSAEREQTNEAIEAVILKSCKNNAWGEAGINSDNDVMEYLYRYQIITPRKTGALGAELLNAKARQILLPTYSNKNVFENTDTPMSLYEKVIHLKNENMQTTDGRDVRVYNGQIGIIVHVDTENNEATVRYPVEDYSITYKDSNVRSGLLGYAWALTVHKTQGAEFGTVVIPLTFSHYNMLNNRLLYTAITRAKNKVGLVGESKALWRGSTNNESIHRITVTNQNI